MTSNPPPNPYIAGDPVQGHNRFIGRTDVLRDVLRMLHNPNANAIVLYGQRRIGKTSILLQLQQQLASRKDYIPIYFDLQDKAVLPLSDVLYQLAQRITASIGLEHVPRDLFDLEGNFFRRAFLPQAAKQVGQRSLILLFDEFDVLDSPQKEQSSKLFFPYLRSWMENAVGVKFVFVLGRRPEDLSTNTLAAFKQVAQRQVSLMSREDSLAIVRQSEQNGSLYWGDTGAERIWYWTQGHPYLTQLLCSEIWEAIHDEHFDKPIIVNAYDVDRAVPETLKLGAHAFLWIWNGLPPAERIVMAATAEVNKTVVNQDELTKILTNSGVRLILRELELAPETLIQWDLLRPTEGGYSFAIPILKQWVAINNPLLRVKRDLDSIDPLAESLYQSADGYYRLGNLQEAEIQLRSAIDLNPNHMRSRLLLGNVLLKNGNPLEAVTELGFVYKYDSLLAHQYFIDALLALAKNTPDEDKRLTVYDRILVLEPKHSIAWSEKQIIWRKRAQSALNHLDFENAKQAYQEINDGEGIDYVQAMRHETEKNKLIKDALNYEREEAWDEVILIYEKLLFDFPDEQYLQQKLENAQLQESIAQTYTKALVMLQKGDKNQASQLLIKIINQMPTYRDAIYYLLLSIRDIDIFELQRSNNELKLRLTNQASQFQQLLESERTTFQREVINLKTQPELSILTFQVEKKTHEQEISELKSQRRSLESSLKLANADYYILKNQTDRFIMQNIEKEREINRLNQRLDAILQFRFLNLLIFLLTLMKPLMERYNSWVASTLIWLPLIAATYWSLPNETLHIPLLYSVLLTLIPLAWVLTGLIGGFNSEREIYVTNVIVISLASVIATTIVNRLTVSITKDVASIMAINKIADIEGVICGGVIAGGLTLGTIGGVIAGIVGRVVVNIMDDMENIASSVATSVAGGTSLGVIVGLLGGGGVELGVVIVVFVSLSFKTHGVKWKWHLLISAFIGLGLGGIIYWQTERLTALNTSTSMLSVLAGFIAVSWAIWIAKPKAGTKVTWLENEQPGTYDYISF